MTNVDEYCTKLANTVINRCHEAKTQGEKLAGGNISLQSILAYAPQFAVPFDK